MHLIISLSCNNLEPPECTCFLRTRCTLPSRLLLITVDDNRMQTQKSYWNRRSFVVFQKNEIFYRAFNIQMTYIIINFIYNKVSSMMTSLHTPGLLQLFGNLTRYVCMKMAELGQKSILHVNILHDCLLMCNDRCNHSFDH